MAGVSSQFFHFRGFIAVGKSGNKLFHGVESIRIKVKFAFDKITQIGNRLFVQFGKHFIIDFGQVFGIRQFGMRFYQFFRGHQINILLL